MCQVCSKFCCHDVIDSVNVCTKFYCNDVTDCVKVCTKFCCNDVTDCVNVCTKLNMFCLFIPVVLGESQSYYV